MVSSNCKRHTFAKSAPRAVFLNLRKDVSFSPIFYYKLIPNLAVKLLLLNSEVPAIRARNPALIKSLRDSSSFPSLKLSSEYYPFAISFHCCERTLLLVAICYP